MQSPNKLVMPAGVTIESSAEETAEAYMNATLAVPSIMRGILKELEEINNSLSFLAFYIEKKGSAEGLIHPDDLEDGADDGPKAG